MDPKPNPYLRPLLTWYGTHARDLPWRRADATPWAILVSEVMLQQTPVARVLPAYHAWLRRWPAPRALAAAAPGEAVRQWGTLGYPRRALNLHAAARVIVDRHDGRVPASYQELRAIPGIGDYTAAAVASFAYGKPHAVLDTNVRRVLARLVGGTDQPPRTTTAAERHRAESLLPDGPLSASWNIAVMELGALVCTARSPRCVDCPVSEQCAWQQAGLPPYEGRRPSGQRYAGTDRQCRGRLLAVLRHATEPVPKAELDPVWEHTEQRERALASLVVDRLAVVLPDGRYALPS